MLTVACVLKSGGDFSFSDVKSLYHQLKSHLDIRFSFAVLTDVELPYPYGWAAIPLIHGLPGYWSKIELFRPNLFVGRVVYLDLDTILVESIDMLAIYPHKFSMLRPFNPDRKFGEWASGVMAWEGDYSRIYNKFIKTFKGSFPTDKAGDQKYIHEYLGFEPEAIQNILSGVYSYKRHCQEGVPVGASVICFHGKPRPSEVTLNRGAQLCQRR